LFGCVGRVWFLDSERCGSGGLTVGRGTSSGDESNQKERQK